MEQNTPYFLREYSKKEYSICCKLPDGTTSNVCGHANKETAEFIVRACNSYQAMLDANKHTVEVFRSMANRGAYPKELLCDYEEFMGKQGWRYILDAIKLAEEV